MLEGVGTALTRLWTVVKNSLRFFTAPPKDPIGSTAVSLAVLPNFRTEPETFPTFPLSPPEPLPEIPQIPEITPPPTVPTVPTVPRVSRRRIDDQDRQAGETAFIYFNDILEQLPTARRLLQKVREVDLHAYAFHRRLGARLLAPASVTERGQMAPTFASILPANGMVYVPYDPENLPDQMVPCSFLYFQKVAKTASHIVVPRGATTIYRMAAAYHLPGENLTAASSFMVGIVDGRAQTLLEKAPWYQELPRGDGFWKMRWDVSWDLQRSWTSARAHKWTKTGSPQEYGEQIFNMATYWVNTTGKEFNVRAERDGVSLSFGVALKRTPYFFKDREVVLNDRGKKRRIFHAVAEHERVTVSGKVTTVPAHYRGLRRFVWKDETITITRPENAPTLIWTLPAEELSREEHRQRPKGSRVFMNKAAKIVLQGSERMGGRH